MLIEVLIRRGRHTVLVWLGRETRTSLVGKEIEMAMDKLQAVVDETVAALSRAKAIVDNASASGAAKDAQIAALDEQLAAAEGQAISIVQPAHDAAVALAPPPAPVPLLVSPTSINGSVGQSLTDSLSVSGGTAPYSFSSSLGDVSVDSSGNVTGTPAAAETGSVTVTDSSSPALTADVPVTIS